MPKGFPTPALSVQASAPVLANSLTWVAVKERRTVKTRGSCLHLRELGSRLPRKVAVIYSQVFPSAKQTAKHSTPRLRAARGQKSMHKRSAES